MSTWSDAPVRSTVLRGGAAALARPARMDSELRSTPYASSPVVDARLTDPHLADVHAEPAGGAGARRGVGGSEQRLGGDAARPQAVAAGAVALDQQHAGPEARGGLRADHARRPTTDDQQVHSVVVPSPAHVATVGAHPPPDRSVTQSARQVDLE